ncbi:MAG: Gfo/Idh/MocA family oxidoreductase, partial [Armatimonadota bacterium]|nr:Gfo/Idh/MocA family oxidoreductase [Armatimonadota bacterium]
AGKDVYLEKPLTRTLEEAHQVADCVKKTGRVLQVGAQWTSQPKWRRAKELLPQIGHPVWSQTSYCRNSIEGEWNYPIEEQCTPDTLDWEAFLGPAPKVPFSRERYFRWRKYWDYSSGIAGDLMPHKMHPLFLVLGLPLPSRVVAAGGLYVHKDREVPDVMQLLADFPTGHTMLVSGSTCNERGLDDLIRGHKATMELQSDRQIVIKPERVYAEEVEGGPEDVETLMEDPMRTHEKNFMECVRTRKSPNCGIEIAYPVMVTVAMGEMSFRQNRMVRIDPQTRKLL